MSNRSNHWSPAGCPWRLRPEATRGRRSKIAPRSGCTTIQKKNGWSGLQPSRLENLPSSSGELGQELVVGLVLLERGNERLHRLDRIQVHHHPAQLADG